MLYRITDRRYGGRYSGDIGDPVSIEGDVEIDPHKNLLAREINILDR